MNDFNNPMPQTLNNEPMLDTRTPMEIEKEKFEKFVADKTKAGGYQLRKRDYVFRVIKKILSDGFSELYISCIPIDNAYKYYDPLKKMSSDAIMDELNTVKSIKELNEKFKDSSPYIKNMIPMAESIAINKANDIENAAEEFPKDVILDSDDMKIIVDFENLEGKDIYADEIKNRVLDVYEAEAKLAKDQQEKTQKIVEELSKKNDGVITESILNHGIQLANGNEANTLLHSIYVSKTKNILNEAGTGSDINSYKEDILVETLSTYTLLECIHSLGIKTIGVREREELKSKFLIS